MLRLANVDMTNKLIYHDILHEYTSKIMKYYDSMSRIQQCFKCQKYNHRTYECRNKQTCEYCAKKHRIKHCDIKKQTNRHRCDACQKNHVEWYIECSTRKKNWIKKKTLRNKSMLHVANTTTSSINVFIFFMSIIFFAVTIEQKKRKIVTSTSQRDRLTSEIKQQKQNEINVQTTIMKRILKKRKMSTISTISHSSSQKTLLKRKRDVIVEFNDQKMIEIIDVQKTS